MIDLDLFGNFTSGAVFDKKRNYRYALMRIWDNSKPKVAFIGLNPSTANEKTNDNTITKVVKIAANNGFGGLYMLNLFAFITAHPHVLMCADDPIGNNDEYIDHYSRVSKEIVFCWGAFKQAKERAKEVIKKYPGALCLDHNADRSPKHPLYCRDNTTLKPYII